MPGTLDHSPADVLRYLLVAGGYGTLPASNSTWPIFVDNLPDAPDAAMLLTDTEGKNHGRTMTDGQRQESHGVSILVRGVSHQAVWQKAHNLAVYLEETVLRTTVTVSSSTYLVQSVSKINGPLGLGKEIDPPTERNLVSVNVTVSLRKTS